ncbi:MAG: glutathione S-transferase family protein [Rhodospirillum sp.]|nr:glutathione S-transferase family protein [Rhodospirillum sp.]MCF8488732.1 glutathione S-transferase family protein [Rhodospirillum sp.]MCF8503071.1 glutathione S-transferase family protein [Rhodospirillum sp.]
MGLLIDGQWRDRWYDTCTTGGRFQRQDSAFRDRVSSDGSTPFPAEPGRYHLYVSLACPWAHRTLIARKIKGLEKAVSVSVVDPLMLENGWELGEGADPVNGARLLHQVYTRAKADYSGRVTVPVLWDKKAGTLVNNESSEILRMMNADFGGTGPDLYPEDLRGEIDALNGWIYDSINNGVYKAGFATTQEAYEEAVTTLFQSLDRVEGILAETPFLTGERITEADWRLFTTLIRFDAVYVGHFKCNLRRIADYPNLWDYTRALYQVPGVAGTVNMEHIKTHYYGSHKTINPTGVIPIGPILDLDRPAKRGTQA